MKQFYNKRAMKALTQYAYVYEYNDFTYVGSDTWFVCIPNVYKEEKVFKDLIEYAKITFDKRIIEKDSPFMAYYESYTQLNGVQMNTNPIQCVHGHSTSNKSIVKLIDSVNNTECYLQKDMYNLFNLNMITGYCVKAWGKPVILEYGKCVAVIMPYRPHDWQADETQHDEKQMCMY